MMGIMVPETCWASNKICNKNHQLHLVGILFPHINDDARSKSLQIHCYESCLCGRSVDRCPKLLNLFGIGLCGKITGQYVLLRANQGQPLLVPLICILSSLSYLSMWLLAVERTCCIITHGVRKFGTFYSRGNIRTQQNFNTKTYSIITEAAPRSNSAKHAVQWELLWRKRLVGLSIVWKLNQIIHERWTKSRGPFKVFPAFHGTRRFTTALTKKQLL